MGRTVFPIRSQGCQKLLPVNVVLIVAIKHVGYSIHFHVAGREIL